MFNQLLLKTHSFNFVAFFVGWGLGHPPPPHGEWESREPTQIFTRLLENTLDFSRPPHFFFPAAHSSSSSPPCLPLLLILFSTAHTHRHAEPCVSKEIHGQNWSLVFAQTQNQFVCLCRSVFSFIYIYFVLMCIFFGSEYSLGYMNLGFRSLGLRFGSMHLGFGFTRQENWLENPPTRSLGLGGQGVRAGPGVGQNMVNLPRQGQGLGGTSLLHPYSLLQFFSFSFVI